MGLATGVFLCRQSIWMDYFPHDLIARGEPQRPNGEEGLRAMS